MRLIDVLKVGRGFLTDGDDVLVLGRARACALSTTVKLNCHNVDNRK